MIRIDSELSRRIERAEGTANAAFVEARSRITPERGSTWMEIAGTYAMYDGPDSPCTQTFGLGLFDTIGNAELEKIEDFFSERHAPTFHEISPIAGNELLPLFNERGYKPIELSSVLCCDIQQTLDVMERRGSAITTRVIRQDEIDLWARTSAAGWATEHESLGDFMFGFGQIAAQCNGSQAFLAELDGQAIATGMLFLHDGIALMAGASTIPEARNQGAQNALLYDRLKFAAEQGRALASMAALPGGQSQINAQKNGFQIAYTRTKWELKR